MTSVEIPYSIACALPSLTVIDITNDVSHELARNDHSDGIAYISPADETGIVRVNERETGFFAELVGRSLTYRLDVGRHVAAPAYASADYYPFLLAAVKGGIALMLARLAWRFARAHAAARAGRRLLAAVGSQPTRAPRMRVVFS